MKKTLFLLTGLGFALASTAQNNALVINNDAFLVLNGGTDGTESVIVVNQSHQDGIITAGTGGNIITKGEFDYIKWNVGTSTGAYNIPLTSDVGNVKIPLTVGITGGGTGSGYMAISTWDVSTGAGQFDNTPYASEVTHMAGANGSADNSENAVDRFWIIDVSDPLGTGETYSAIPTPSITFGYNSAVAETGDGNDNSMVGNLGGQHFDPVGENWHGAGAGAASTGIWGVDNGAGLVTGVVPDAGTWFRSWTLANFLSPLPVELNFFETECKTEGVIITWQTASETNASHFEVYKSFDGIEFEYVETIQAQGNSNVNVDYSMIDESINTSDAMYKLVQVDFDGTSHDMTTEVEHACISNAGLNVYGDMNGDVVIDWNASVDGAYDVVLYDGIGKQVSGVQNINVVSGFNQFKLSYMQLAFGNYMIQISNGEETFVKKLVIR